MNWLNKPPTKPLLGFKALRETVSGKIETWHHTSALDPSFPVRKTFYERVLIPAGHAKLPVSPEWTPEWTFSKEYFHALEYDNKALRALLKLTL